MLKVCIPGVMIGLLLCAGTVMAYPTLTGPTGQAVIPTADMADTGVEVAGDWVDLTDTEMLGVDGSIPLRALLSLGSDAEVGVMFDPFSDENAFIDDVWGANVKIKAGKLSGGEAALGAQFRRENLGEDDAVDYTQGYFVWTSHSAPTGDEEIAVALTAGVNWTQVKTPDGDWRSGFRAFGGVSIKTMEQLELMAEFQSRSSEVGDANPITSMALRYSFTPTTAFQVGFTNAFGLIGLPDHNLFAGLDCSLEAGF